MAPNASSSMATLADLTASTRRTTGERPPPLVGASTTVIGSKVYLFGGRLVPTRTMVNTLYTLDLETLVWQQLWPSANQATSTLPHEASNGVGDLENINTESALPDRGPQARYFHSCDAYADRLFIFGGMGYVNPSRKSPSNPSPQDQRLDADSSHKVEDDNGLCVLDDLIVYDTRQNTWSFPSRSVSLVTEAQSPGRSSSATDGGSRPSPRYAHLSCVSNHCLVILGGQDLANRYLQEISVLDLESMTWAENRRFEGHCGTYRSVALSRAMSVHYPDLDAKRRSRTEDQTDGDLASSLGGKESSLVQLPYSSLPTRDNPEPIFMYSNFNFSAVRRALDLISAPKPPTYACPMAPLSQLMSSGPSLPPGLRFPTGAIVGGHLIIAGTFLSHAQSCFAIWSLDLANHARGGRLQWTKVDPGGVMSGGASWNRAVAWGNTIVILGDRDRQIAEDYDHRQLNFTHCAFIDLEAFGIYYPPLRLLPVVQQDLGLRLLNNRALTDFDFICADGQRVSCSRALLEQRWPWFASAMRDFRAKARGVGAPGYDVASDVRLSPRELLFPESADQALAAMQYFYTLTLCTPLQNELHILVGLLVFSKTYDVPNLRALATHALHDHLQKAPAEGAGSTAMIYEAATLAGCLALQIRSLKTLMQASRIARTRIGGPRPIEPAALTVTT